jgi:hypothetical protein
MKFCIECRFAHKGATKWYCVHSVAREPVEGKSLDCELMRTSGFPCGLEARLFEPAGHVDFAVPR